MVNNTEDKKLLENYYDMNPVFTEEEIKLFCKLLAIDNFLSTEDSEEEVSKLLDE